MTDAKPEELSPLYVVNGVKRIGVRYRGFDEVLRYTNAAGRVLLCCWGGKSEGYAITIREEGFPPLRWGNYQAAMGACYKELSATGEGPVTRERNKQAARKRR